MSKSIKIGVGAIAAIVIIGAGVFFLNQNKSEDTANNASTKTSKTSTESPAKKYTDACKVFTKEDLNTALGRTYGDGEEGIAFTTATPGTPDYDNDDLRGSVCEFEEETDGSTEAMRASLDISIDVNTHKDVAGAKQFMSDLSDPQTAEGQEAVEKIVDVNGAGDEAFFVKVNAGGSEDKSESLNVRVGRQIIVITATQLSGLDHAAVQAALTTLGKKL
jgi:hypothetical protein